MDKKNNSVNKTDSNCISRDDENKSGLSKSKPEADNKKRDDTSVCL